MTRDTKKNRVRTPRVLRLVGVTAVAAALLAGVAVPGVAAADSTAAAGPRRPDLQAAVQAIVDSGFAGAQLRVHDQRGDWVGSGGVRELGRTAKPPTNGRFRVGSVTKTFVSTVVLQLVGAGSVRLDAPVAGYLPEYGLDRRITVRMLLQHTSGLFDYTGQVLPNGTAVPGIPLIGQEFVDNRFHTYQPDELVRLSLSKDPLFEPGTAWSYGNINYLLAGLLIKKVTGHSYAEEIQRRILGPLRLWETVQPGTWPGIPGPHSHGYYRYQDAGQWKLVDITRQNPSWASSAGDMISTTKDLHTFFSALLAGKLLPRPLLAEMLKPHPKSNYGLGVFLQQTGPNCGGALIIKGEGGFHGYGTLIASTPDGSRTFELALTYGDSAADLGQAYNKADQTLVNQVLCGGQAGTADGA
ncbi:serine hydrolase domain-containing protein [Actinocrispum wychmicini]|uniref:D-alanyl-D-alanine carboxypeptidase n=1 Tax=Actinocrispum wychmicini TaxID=1213861 RepID=A0A4R2K6M4_9PSEU|nr:serine hydrolase domain-containing protein [Actinocrispum wychmicini]TCO61995.1 D-alanyl-D-alanine carboxypeptidase [Actinocrispum wychmicini]